MSSYLWRRRVQRRLRRHVTEPFERRVGAPVRRQLNRRRTYRPVFVAGASGSGTSLMALSLGQRFDVAGVIYETNFQVGEDSFLYVPHIDAFDSVSAYQDFMTPKASWDIHEGRSVLLDCYRRYCWGPSDVVIDKGPDINLLRAAFLGRCFPEGCFVLIFRDPVANVEGLRRKWRTFGRDPLEETIRFYRQIHEAFLGAAAELPPDRVVAVEYEALVEQPEEALAEIGRRLGLAPARRRRRLFSVPNREGQGIRNVQGSRIGYVRDANQRARSRLDPGQIRTIEAALGPLDDRLRRAPLTIRAADLAGAATRARVRTG